MSVDRELTLEETQALSAMPESRLARCWCELNSSRKVPELPNAPTWPVMTWIMNKIGFKACLREWNRDNMDDEQFETFWRSHARR
jgi:hypothetical protein